MKKKIFLLLSIVLALSIFIFIAVTIKSSKEEIKKENNNIEEKESISEDNTKKSLVIYFSATGNTEDVAKKIQKVTNSDIEEIIPKEKYTSSDLDYGKDNSRANKEQNSSSSRPEIKKNIDVTNYEIIYLGYPIWWGDVPKIILTFLDTHNLEGKTVVPFCTSGGSGISQSQDELESYNKKINWLKGKRFSSNIKEKEISSWIKELNK